MKGIATPTKAYAGEFSPEETVFWMTETWERKAKPLFANFYTLLEKETSIPSYYFSKLNHGSSGWNPIFRFLRPETVQSFYNCFKATVKNSKSGSKKVERIWDSVLLPYLNSWEDLFDRLANFYGDAACVQEVRESFHSLRYASSIFQEPDPQRTATKLTARLLGSNKDRPVWIDTANYSCEFDNFCKTFSRLPAAPRKKTALAEEILFAVAKTIQAETKKTLKKAKEISDHSAIKAYKLATEQGLDNDDGKILKRKATGKGNGKRGRHGPPQNELDIIKAAYDFYKARHDMSHLSAIRCFLKNPKNWKDICPELPTRFSQRPGEPDMDKAVGRLNSAVAKYDADQNDPHHKNKEKPDAFGKRNRKSKVLAPKHTTTSHK